MVSMRVNRFAVLWGENVCLPWSPWRDPVEVRGVRIWDRLLPQLRFVKACGHRMPPREVHHIVNLAAAQTGSEWKHFGAEVGADKDNYCAL